jgi:predicted dehydrogenase
MSRLSPLPEWSNSDVYKQRALTGGCNLDLHIHDIDVLRYLLGDPRAVSSVASLTDGGEEYISTRLEYDGVLAEAEASFDEARTVPFFMGYRARFEKATVILEGDRLTVYPTAGEPYSPELEKKDRIAEEIRCICDAIRGKENKDNPPSESVATIRLMEIIKKSAEGNRRIDL